MLGKLIKHEWKAMTKVGLILIAVNLFIVIVEALYYFTPFWRKGINGAEENVESAIFMLVGVAGLLLVSLIITGTIYAIYIFIAIRYYKSMFSAQGYLTNTLPVSVHKHLWARILVGSGWAVLITIACFVALGVNLFAMITRSTFDSEKSRAFVAGLREGLAILEIPSLKGQICKAVLLIVVIFLVTTVCGMIKMFAAFAIGQLSNKHKALVGTVVCLGFFAIEFFVCMIIGMTQVMEALFEMTEGNTNLFFHIGIVSLIINVVLAVVLYFITAFILRKKLNLD